MIAGPRVVPHSVCTGQSISMCTGLRSQEGLFQMRSHAGRGLGQIASRNRFNDGEVLAAPFADTAAVEIAAKFQQAPEAVLVLDRLGEKRVATELGAHLMKCGVRLKEL